MKKYAFFDIDGTLLPEGMTEIPSETLQLFDKLRANGVETFICTGRCYHQAKQYIKSTGCESYVVSNGQEANLKGEEVYSYNLSYEEVAYLREKIVKYNLFWGYETRSNVFLQNAPGAKEVARDVKEAGFLGVTLEDYSPDKKIKQIWVFGQLEEIKKLEADIYEKFKYYRWTDDSLEIIPLEESKAKGVKKILEACEEEVMTYAFGDGFNDIELLEVVDVGVAMGNGKQELKVVADYVTDDIDKGGLKKALEHFNLI